MPEKKRQSRGLGLWMSTALVAGNMIGSGVFLLPASLASFGSISLLAWLCTSIGAMLLALVFSKMSVLVPKAGGPYAYAREGFGDFVGFQIAYNYWIALWVGNAAIAVAFAGYLSVFFPTLASNSLYACLVAVAAVWLMAFINIIGVRQAGVVQVVATVLKLLPLLLIATLGLAFIHPHYLTAFNVSGQSHFMALTGAASLTLWSFVGLESATIPANDIDNPQRNIPLATTYGTLITAVIYILSTLAVMGMVPLGQLAHSPSPYAEAANVMFGPWGRTLVAIGAIISCIGALNGWTLLAGQIPCAVAKDGLFPSCFARTTASGTPIIGLISSSLLITALLLLTLRPSLVKQFTFIILLATLASLIPYLFTCMAELMLFIQQPQRFRGTRLLGSVVIAGLAAVYIFWAIAGTGADMVYYGCLLLLTSLPAYVIMRWRAEVKAG